MTAGTTDNTDKSGKTGRWAPWRNLRWAFIAIWLVFLAYPIQSVARADVSTPAKALGFVLLAAFAVVYTITAVHVLAGPPGRAREGLIALVALTAITVALTPTIHENALGTGPFLMAVAAFTFPLAWAFAVVIVLLAATILIPGWAGWGSDTNIAIIMTVVAFTMLGIRFLRAREVEREEAQEAQRSLNERLAVVAERERLARDVHDILGHSLTVITVKSELAGKLLDRDPDRAREEMTDINTLARQALSEVRATVGQ
ncbi:MAG: histidine kinase dimerization/phosphoacceptor domain-containing protein, partial [Gordonia amarae]